ncbi:uncharacterized protein C8orf76 homolog isoform X4 [Ranitomeya variabilis]|uniref:uncharacterized protein C8orf76 homolog isoform X4 n=1 Tax=Ranitomeya variabilis TaxID=490064 RepID=UPI004055C441
MECDFCFEDSVFSETRERTSQRGLSYPARQCEPRWFIANVNQDDLLEAHTVLKFRADLSYRREDYAKAFTVYSDCYALIPLANNAMRRDVQESQARCLIRLGRHKEALEIAELLFWICLAESYITLFLSITNCKDPSHNSNRFSLWAQSPLGAQQCVHDIARARDPTVSRDDNSVLGPCNRSDPSSLTDDTNGEQLWTWSCACFIRARLLLRLLQPQQASFVLENNMKTQEQIEKLLEKLGLLEGQTTLIVQVMGEDLLAERTKEEGQTDIKTTQTLTSFIMPSDAEFKVRWFQKMTTILMANK